MESTMIKALKYAKTLNRKLISSLKPVVLLSLFLCLAACSTPEEVVQSHYENGMELLDEKDFIKASIEFRNALQIDDQFVPAWYGMSLVEDENKEWVKVIGLLNKIIELEPTHIEAQVRLGTLMLLLGELDSAVAASEAALLLDNQNANVLALRGAVMLKLEDRVSAVDFANRSLAIEAGNLNAIQVLAAERFSARDYDGALAFIDQSNNTNGANRDLMLIAVYIYETKGEIENAERAFKTLAEQDPDDKEIRVALVNFYVKHGKIDEAELEIRGVAAQDPADFDASIDVVRFINSYRDSAQTEQELLSLIQRGTDVVKYQLALSQFYLEQGDLPASKKVLEKIVDRTGSSEDGLIARARLGEMALVANDNESALRIINEILEIDNVNVAALEMRGSINLNESNYDAAIQDLRIVLNETPNSVRASLLLSKAYELLGSIELADDTLSDAFRFSQNNSVVGITYSEFLLKQSAPDRAEGILTDLLNRDPKNIEVLKFLAQVRIVQRDWVGAQQVSEALKQAGDQSGVSTQIEGIAFSGQQNYAQSILAFRDAYSAAPGETRPLVSLIGTYIRAGQREEAEEFLNSLLVENENNYLALVLLGQLQMINQNTDEAIETLQSAIAMEPDTETAYVNLIAHYIRVENYETALITIEDAVLKVENKMGIQLTKANIFEQQKQFEDAIDVYESMLEVDPNSDVVINNLASLLSEYRTDNASLQRAQDLAQRFRQSAIPHFKDTLGWIYYKVGDIQAASSLLQDVVEQMPQMIIFRYHLGSSYMAEGRNEAAIREFEEVIKLSENQPLEQLEEVKELLVQLKSAS